MEAAGELSLSAFDKTKLLILRAKRITSPIPWYKFGANGDSEPLYLTSRLVLDPRWPIHLDATMTVGSPLAIDANISCFLVPSATSILTMIPDPLWFPCRHKLSP